MNIKFNNKLGLITGDKLSDKTSEDKNKLSSK